MIVVTNHDIEFFLKCSMKVDVTIQYKKPCFALENAIVTPNLKVSRIMIFCRESRFISFVRDDPK